MSTLLTVVLPEVVFIIGIAGVFFLKLIQKILH